MAKQHKSSTGDTHPYLKGYRFWSVNQFWRDPSRIFSDKAIAYYDKWLSDMFERERTSYALNANGVRQ